MIRLAHHSKGPGLEIREIQERPGPAMMKHDHPYPAGGSAKTKGPGSETTTQEEPGPLGIRLAHHSKGPEVCAVTRKPPALPMTAAS